VTGLGPPWAGPDTCWWATVAGAWVQERPHGLPGRSVQPERHADGHRRPPRHTRPAPRGTRGDAVPHRWRGTVPGGGERRGLLALSTSAHHLAAAHADGLVPAQPSVKGWARVVGSLAHRARWFHRTEQIIQHTICPNTLLKMH